MAALDSMDLASIWHRVALGTADSQEKIDVAWSSGEAREIKYVPNLKRLLRDEDGEVRYYALQALVLDLQQVDPEMAETCWRLLASDPDDDVRGMAAACLGKIYFNSFNLDVFHRFVKLLMEPNSSSLVAASVYDAIFMLPGRPPSDWPSLKELSSNREWQGIDWNLVAELEDEIRGHRRDHTEESTMGV